jgi:hypothetical protein
MDRTHYHWHHSRGLAVAKAMAVGSPGASGQAAAVENVETEVSIGMLHPRGTRPGAGPSKAGSGLPERNALRDPAAVPEAPGADEARQLQGHLSAVTQQRKQTGAFKAKNHCRDEWQKVGLLFLSLSFFVQAVAVFLKLPRDTTVPRLRVCLDGHVIWK